MKKLLLSLLLFTSISGFAQNYNDLFTTYKSAPTYPNTNQSRSAQPTIPVPQYEVMDPNQFFNSTSPQNVQTTTGVFVNGSQFYSIKLKVGISGTNANQVMVTGYWDGQIWNNTTGYASPIGYGAPEQIKRACTHQVYLAGLGTVYF